MLTTPQRLKVSGHVSLEWLWALDTTVCHQWQSLLHEPQRWSWRDLGEPPHRTAYFYFCDRMSDRNRREVYFGCWLKSTVHPCREGREGQPSLSMTAGHISGSGWMCCSPSKPLPYSPNSASCWSYPKGSTVSKNNATGVAKGFRHMGL